MSQYDTCTVYPVIESYVGKILAGNKFSMLITFGCEMACSTEKLEKWKNSVCFLSCN